jgi:hypothetical protein
MALLVDFVWLEYTILFLTCTGSNVFLLDPLKWPHEPPGEIEVLEIGYSAIY